MHIITFGTDEHMLRQESRQHARLLTYVDMAETYTAIIFSKNSAFEVTKKKTLTGVLTLIQVPKKRLFSELRKVYAHLKQHKKENTVISAQDPFEVGLISYVFSKLLGYPLHVQIHTAIQSKIAQTESLRARVQYATCCFLLPRISSFRVVSQGIKNFLIRKGVDQNKIFISPVIENLPDQLKERAYTGGIIQVLCVARFVSFKNLPTLIEAFGEFSKKHTETHHADTHLTIVGGGPLKNVLLRKIAALQLREKVTLLDWVPDVVQLYKKSDLYIHASYYEGFGMAIVEALHFGVPVLVTPDVGAVDYVTNENGYVMNGYESADLVQGLEYGVKNLVGKNPREIRNSLHIVSKQDNDLMQKASYSYSLQK